MFTDDNNNEYDEFLKYVLMFMAMGSVNNLWSLSSCFIQSINFIIGLFLCHTNKTISIYIFSDYKDIGLTLVANILNSIR